MPGLACPAINAPSQAVRVCEGQGKGVQSGPESVTLSGRGCKGWNTVPGCTGVNTG